MVGLGRIALCALAAAAAWLGLHDVSLAQFRPVPTPRPPVVLGPPVIGPSVALPAPDFAIEQPSPFGAQSNPVVRGDLAHGEDWEYFVALRSVHLGAQQFRYFCGGALITPQWVVTAAHCVARFTRDSAGRYRAHDGGVLEIAQGVTSLGYVTTRDVAQVRAIRVHPRYATSSGAPINDIALVQLTRPRMIEAPLLDASAFYDAMRNRSRESNYMPGIGNDLYVAGFGVTAEGAAPAAEALQSGFSFRAGSDMLLEGDVPLRPNEVCRGAFATFDPARHICGGFAEGGEDSCNGDSGGPLVQRARWFERPEQGQPFIRSVHMLVGLVSFGRGCARPGVPAVYLRVSAYESWMASVMGGRR